MSNSTWSEVPRVYVDSSSTLPLTVMRPPLAQQVMWSPATPTTRFTRSSPLLLGRKPTAVSTLVTVPRQPVCATGAYSQSPGSWNTMTSPRFTPWKVIVTFEATILSPTLRVSSMDSDGT